jgi:2-keto-4-pentenoate hydratase/2-oxohepta-3-ene-1,7-dioic acid hydratase in catechol pathway
MRLIQFDSRQGPRAGLVDDSDQVFDLGSAGSLAVAPILEGRLPDGRPGPDLNELQFLPPLFGSRRIFAVGYNYRTHAGELDTKVPEWPNFFIRTPESLVGHKAVLEYPHGFASYDYEGELALVIGKPGRNIPEPDALAHVLGYSCFLDGSVREIQAHSLAAGKNFERSGAMGPWIMPASRLPADPTFKLKTAISGVIRQEGSSADMVFPVAHIVHALSLVTTLMPGDVISTGTPSRVGVSFDPPRFLNPGDEVRVTVDAIGTLHNRVSEHR